MSLKALHLVFITASILLCLAFGGWEIRAYKMMHEHSDLYMAVGSFVGAIALVIYERSIMRKLRHISYL
jgi:uncharacterized membrane protein YcjF (UPF0283 family)